MYNINVALMTGIDIPLPMCQLTLHQPSIREIGMIGEEDFFVGIQTLGLYKSMFVEDKAVLDEISNFQIFMMIMKDKETQEKKRSVLQLLNLIFPNYKAMITPQSLIFTSPDSNEPIMIDDNNFESLQEIIREVFCFKTGPMDKQAFNPANSKAKEIADKLMKGRQRVAAQKSADKSSVFQQYISILSVALHISIIELSKYTMFQLYDEMDRYILHLNWDLDVRQRLAGGKPDSQPENWMKNIH